MRILIIDNNIDLDAWGAGNLRKYAVTVPGATVEVRRAPQEDLPKDLRVYDRIVISGSKTSCLEDAPWIAKLDEEVRRAMEARQPILGVCYGHQIIARAIGGKASVRRGENGEFGWTQIERLPGAAGDSPLLEGLPRQFHSFSSHYEEVGQLAKGMRQLARSRDCELQAFEVEGYPVFGIQFHPEKNLADGEQIFREQRAKNELRTLLRPKEGLKLYDPQIATRIFDNFFKGAFL